MKFSELNNHFFEVASFDGEARDILAALDDVVGLVKDDYAIFEADVEVFAELFLDDVVVWHEDDVCTRSSVFHREIWTHDLLFGHLVQILDVEWIPSHGPGSDISIFEVHARVYGLLDGLASRVQRMTPVHVDGRVHTKMVSRSQDDRSWLEDSISELLLHLRELTVRPGRVDDLGELHVSFAREILALCFQPRKSST